MHSLWHALTALAACGTPVTAPADPPPSAGPPPDLVLVLAAGLRADPRDQPMAEAAFLEALPGTRYRDAYAQSPSPFVSLGSILTGRYPSSIPLCGFFASSTSGASGDPFQALGSTWCARLPADQPTLPSVLGLYGYRSLALVSGLDQAQRVLGGFQEVQQVPFTGPGTDPEALTAAAARWWGETTTVDSPGPRLLVAVLADLLVSHRPDLRERMDLDRLTRDIPEARFRRGKLPGEDQVVQVYQEEARRVGSLVADLLQALPPSGDRPRQAWVAGLNGQSLLEQRGFYLMSVPPISTSFVVDRGVHVPLVRVDPEERAQVEGPVELLDLLPTFCSLAGAAPPAGIPGQDLRLPVPPDALAWAEFGDTLMLRSGPFSLLFRAWVHNTTSLDARVTTLLEDPRILRHPRRLALYHVLRDPWQEQDLRLQEPQVFHALWSRAVQVRRGPAAPPSLAPDQVRDIHLTPSQGYW